MEIRQLRYLLAIAEEANFTRAAEKVFVSQSALSQQIQVLEGEVGAVLLERSKRGVRLTPAGEALCHHARRIMLEVEQAGIALKELEGLGRGDLRVGVVQTVNDYLIPALVSAFAHDYPHIRLMIEELSSDDIEDRLISGDLQLGLSFIPAASPAIDAEPLFEEELVLIIRRDHPFAGRDSVAVADLHGMPMVQLARTFCTRRLWEEKARLAGAIPHIMMEMNTVSTILSIVEKTGLASVLPRHTLRELRSDALTSLTLHSPSPSRTVGVLWARDGYVCAASRAFISAAHGASVALAQPS
ncbi:MAG: transcriptional regulator CynR [Pleurocapsa minor GSE-CHR-MK-17-07R]|jgi:LysR family cyn operon transcriptional activator|nr:transcriptional regulator CynR [Pleurocapsa minor GSE-CHR-MK 17-07R]